MKQNLQITVKHFMTILVMLSFMSVATTATAQKSNPPKKAVVDPMLDRRAALEVSQRLLSEWSATLNTMDVSDPAYKVIETKFALLYVANEQFFIGEGIKVEEVITKSSALMATATPADVVMIGEATLELRKELSKKANPQYKY